MSRPRHHWHKMKPDEKRAELERRDREKFPRLHYRCRYCRIVVDAATRDGHLGRCADAAAAGVTFARGAPTDEHFTEEETQ